MSGRWLLVSCACVALNAGHVAAYDAQDVLMALPVNTGGIVTMVNGQAPVLPMVPFEKLLAKKPDNQTAANVDIVSGGMAQARVAMVGGQMNDGPLPILEPVSTKPIERRLPAPSPIIDEPVLAQAPLAGPAQDPAIPQIQEDVLVQISAPVPPTNAPIRPAKPPVDYAADKADFDRDSGIAVLEGSVEIIQEGRKLQADKVVYYLKDDVAVADGNVIITEVNGDVYHAQSVEMADKMRRALVKTIFVEMTDGSRIWAASGRKHEDNQYSLEDARYTACKACEENPERRPPWQIKASDVRWLQDEQRVEYKNAWFEAGGVPFFYTPYFSHPDGTVEQKSGILAPQAGWNSDLGAFYSQSYYWAISPSMDMTFTAMAMTDQMPLLRQETRLHMGNLYFESDASGTYSKRIVEDGQGQNVKTDNKWRGHLFANGGWDINSLWRARANIEVASDRQYLRQYGISDENILTSDIYAERFEGRDYALIKGMAFQDLRQNWRNIDQPNILPVGHLSMLGAPGGLLGGRWAWDSSVLSLVRDGKGQDVFRATTSVGWQRRDIVPFGLVLESELAARGDAYWVNNRIEAVNDPTEPRNRTIGRFVPHARVEASYPLQQSFSSFQFKVEPIVSFYGAPSIKNDDRIPNEDSQDLQLDSANLFVGNRFPGLDRVEDRTHVAYGVRTGLYKYTGGEVSAFVGQSYDIGDDQSLYPAGSGLERRQSDYVGDVKASFDGGRHNLIYKYQLDSKDMSSKRHELFGRSYWGPVSVDGTYLYARGTPGTAYAESREQIRFGSTIDLNDMWQVRGQAVYDLSPASTGQRGLRRAIGRVAYNHECYDVAVTVDRNLASAVSGAHDTTFMVRLGLKNLGAYETGAFQLPQSSGN